MALIKEKDFGTPKVKSTKQINLTIDGFKVSVCEGTSIMRAAAEIGILIPKLCATDRLNAFGSCRLCLVEVDGLNGTPASCTTPVKENMNVKTQTSRIADLRRGVMELYISDHPLDCLTCSDNGDCELQDMAGIVGLRDVRYGYDGGNHSDSLTDTTNPYFEFDPSKCIVCSRCVRACDEIQGTFALTIKGRGFDSKVAASLNESFFDSECVSCGACVQACPTATLQEKKVVEHGVPNRTVSTTCAYCGVGCSFKAELKGNQVVRMVPDNNGKANHGHSCVKGRFAWGYATHKDRIKKPMIRNNTKEPWKEVTWDQAISFAAQKLKKIQNKYGRKSIGAISSSRCTIEEVWVVQKLVRTAFSNNNIDTCARVCHSPTGYGLKQTFGTSAGTQDFDSVDETSLILLIGANPTDAHPVFASQMKRRLRSGANLIVADPRSIDLVRSPHVEAKHYLPLKPGTNVALINAIAHVIATEDLMDQVFIKERCDIVSFGEWLDFIREDRNSPESLENIIGVSSKKIREAARMYAKAENAAIYYGLGVTEHSQGSTMVMGMANLAMATGNIGRRGVGVNPLRGQNNVQGSCDMGSFPHEFPGYRPVSDESVRNDFEKAWGITQDSKPGFRIPNMFDEACGGNFKGLYVQGEDLAQSDPNTQHVEEALNALDILIVQDLFLNETAKFAHVFLPGTSFLEKDGCFINAERRINRVRPVMESSTGIQEWEVTQLLANAMGYTDMAYKHSSEIMDEIAMLTPTFSGVSHAFLDQEGSVQWPCNENAPYGTPIMHIEKFVRGKGQFITTEFIPTTEKTNDEFPLLLTTGRILSQYNVGAQTRRTDNMKWNSEDVLEMEFSDAEQRGIQDGQSVSVKSRKGQITLKVRISERISPGVVYTTFHHPVTGVNVVTTENSDWATNCPEYKVTAVEVKLTNEKSNWQKDYLSSSSEMKKINKSHRQVLVE